MKRKHIIGLLIVYTIIFFTSAALINYYAYFTLDPRLLVSGSMLLAVIATWMHHRYRIKTKADEIAKKLEDVL